MLGCAAEQGSQEQLAALQQERDDALARLAEATNEVQALRAGAQGTNGSRQVSSLLQKTAPWQSVLMCVGEHKGEEQQYLWSIS